MNDTRQRKAVLVRVETEIDSSESGDVKRNQQSPPPARVTAIALHNPFSCRAGARSEEKVMTQRQALQKLTSADDPKMNTVKITGKTHARMLAEKNQSTMMQRELEKLAVEDGQQRGMFFDTSGKLHCEHVSATATHAWIFKTTAGQPFQWNTTESKHTSGPWTANIGGAGCNVALNSTMQAPVVVLINQNWLLTHPELVEEAQANARLIASAPELLTALQAIEKMLISHNAQHPWIPGAQAPEALRIIRAAIANATGKGDK